MNKFTKIVLTSLAVLIAISASVAIYDITMGNFFANAGIITSGLLIIGVVVLFYILISWVKHLWTLSLILFIGFTIQGCSHAKVNQQVLISNDCGMNWKSITSGDVVPKGAMNPCFMKVVIPNYPMQGDSKFISNLAGKVKVNVEIDYDYSIINGLAFIREAKYIGKTNADVDSDDALNSVAFESAENRVIEKRIREVAKALFVNEDIVELDQTELEDKLEAASNKMLEKFGVKLNFITLTFIPDEQTKEAIDVATAMRIYESKGLKEIGEKIMAQRAGATKITVENKTQLPAQTND